MPLDPAYLLQLTANGVILGLLYALIVAGLALIFGVLEIINFAHGEFLMAGAYAMAFILPLFGLNYWPAMAAAVLLTGLAGFVVYELFLARVGQSEFERAILITLGLSMILVYGAQYLFSATPRLVDTNFGFAGLDIGTVRITWTRIVAGAEALAAFAGLYGVLNFTQFGRAMRAIAQNREAALMVGIRPKQVARNAVMLATALCGLAGAALAPMQTVQPGMGQAVIFKAFALVIIGGLGNMAGAVTAALVLGLLESWIGGFLDIAWQNGAVFTAMILVLLLRPDGLFQRGGMRL
ncbi:MAG TPA: branched-chain amino acid ABC transporter permease [Candidatus Sulfotelmatobacter sp.]|nr:branched-chain amino acid ABC transporter permease [Candidatus Sulfotelmatobacter sp.]